MAYSTILLLVVTSDLCLLAGAVRADQGTFVGGEMVFEDTKSRQIINLGGEEVHLIQGFKKKDPGEQFPRLDVGKTVPSGPDEGTFVLGSIAVHQTVTLLYYPYPRSTDGAPQRFLPKVLYPKVSDDGNKWKVRIRLTVEPTDGSITDATKLKVAIEDALCGSELATALDISAAKRRDILQADIEQIAAMVPAEMRRRLYFDAIRLLQEDSDGARAESGKGRLLAKAIRDLKPKLDEVFGRPPAYFDEIRDTQLSYWNYLRAKDSR